MDKTTQLFIRACKVNDPKKRVRSVYRRRYNNYIQNHDRFICEILTKIVDDYEVVSLPKFIHRILERGVMGRNPGLLSHEDIMLELIHCLRFTRVTQFPGLTTPAPFRKRYGNQPMDATDKRELDSRGVDNEQK